MATVGQYVNQLLTQQRALAKRLGADLGRADKQTRVLNMANLVLAAIIIKVLVDKGVISNADLQAGLATAQAEIWDDLTTEPDDTD